MLRLRLDIDLPTCTGQGTQIGQRDGEGFDEAGDLYNAIREQQQGQRTGLRGLLAEKLFVFAPSALGPHTGQALEQKFSTRAGHDTSIY